MTGRTVVFMFSGHGAQYVNMGLGLYREEPGFRDQINECFDMTSNRFFTLKGLTRKQKKR